MWTPRLLNVSGAAVTALSSTALEWVPTYVPGTRNRFAGYHFGIRTDVGQRLRLDWYLEHTVVGDTATVIDGSGSQDGYGQTSQVVPSGIVQPPAASGGFREQSEESGGSGIITHYPITRRIYTPTPTTTGAVQQFRHFPLVVHSDFTRIVISATLEAGAVNSTLTVNIWGLVEGYMNNITGT